MSSHDLLRGLAEPLRTGLRATLAAHGAPPAVAAALVEAADAGALVLLAVLLVRSAAFLAPRADRLAARTRRGAADGARIAGALAAAALLWWIVGHPSLYVHELFTRWDHLAFAALAGAALARLSRPQRAWALAALSLVFLGQYNGAVALALVLGSSILAFGALRVVGPHHARAATGITATAIAATYALCWWLRPRDPLLALETYGLFSFLVFRQISIAVSIQGGTVPPVGSYLCYLLFYPSNAGLLGGPEVYPDFARRNLGTRTHDDHGLVAGKIARGMAQVWLADRVPVSFPMLLASTTASAAWSNTLLLLLSSALRAMGLWAMIEASAHLYGFRLQPNFTGILTRTNPSELWWAWRGAFTNWLVRYVYGPLGASRRHQTANILAAFAVSWLWHVVGLPFLATRATATDLAPITLWAGLNATAVAGHVLWQRRGWTILPPATPPALRRALKVPLVWLLASFNVAPLLFQGQHAPRFWGYLRLLLGMWA